MDKHAITTCHQYTQNGSSYVNRLTTTTFASSRVTAAATAIARHRQVYGLAPRIMVHVSGATIIRPEIGMTYSEFINV